METNCTWRAKQSGKWLGAQVDALYAGEVGYLAASIKAVADARVGDTITLKCARRAASAHGPSAPRRSQLLCFPQHARHEYRLL